MFINFNQKYNRDFKHNTPLIKGDIRKQGKAEIAKTIELGPKPVSGEDKKLQKGVEWISFKQKFFNTTLISKTGFQDVVNINVEIHFTTATVDGKTGTMTIEMNMIAFPAHPSDNHGTWRIKDAAGGLEGLHGEGAWLSSPNRYEGKVHFSK